MLVEVYTIESHCFVEIKYQPITLSIDDSGFRLYNL